MISIPKPKKIKSNKMRNAARGNTCTFRIPGVCNGSSQTVVFCHAPSSSNGMGTKSDDFWGADGCSNCHDYVDSHGLFETAQYWVPAIHETLKRRIEKGIIEVK